jgi:hypothetical protein
MKITMIFIIVFISILVSCGKKKEDKISTDAIAKEFDSAAAYYRVTQTRSTESINVVSKATMDSITSSDNSNVAGFCLCPTTSTVCKIYLRQDIWESSNDSSRRQLLFHELGHCNLRRDHNSSAINIGNGTNSSCIFPVSIMFPAMFSSGCKFNNSSPIDFALNHWGEYKSQLFWGDQSSLLRLGALYTPTSSSGGTRPAILITKSTQANSPIETDQSNDDFVNHIYAYKVKKINDCSYVYSEAD